jgi:peptidoglycan hydrolase FlgJ
MENPVQLSEPTTFAPNASNDADGKRKILLMEKAKALEAGFLSEMLSYAGTDATKGAFTGGIGEEQYASFLRDAQSKAIVEHGGIGLAEKLFQSLVRHDHVGE